MNPSTAPRTDKPIYFLLSGPPGAGKSTFGMLVAPLEVDRIIDYDKVRWNQTHEFLKSFPSFSREQADAVASGIATQTVNSRMLEATRQNKSFGVEGMIWQDSSWDFAAQMQKVGYDFHLTYMGLENAALSERRVLQRIAEGGHTYVNGEAARACYEKNLEALHQHYQQPDRLELYDNSGQQELFIARLQKGAVTKALTGKLPDWVARKLPAIASRIEAFQASQQQQLSPTPPAAKPAPATSRPAERRKGLRL